MRLEKQKTAQKAASAQKTRSAFRTVICVVLALLLIGGAVFFFTRPKHKVEAGDTATFGTYAGKPIKWQVMEIKSDGSCVLLSEKGLDARPYNTELDEVTWETCTLRAWLNGEFYETAFSASENGKIAVSTVENPDNKNYGTKGGNTTEDNVYLLSLDEVGRYFHVDPYSDDNYKSDALICLPTAYAKNNGAYTDDAGACWWWLRSPGYGQDDAADIVNDSDVNHHGSHVNYTSGCARLVVCVRL